MDSIIPRGMNQFPPVQAAALMAAATITPSSEVPITMPYVLQGSATSVSGVSSSSGVQGSRLWASPHFTSTVRPLKAPSCFGV